MGFLEGNLSMCLPCNSGMDNSAAEDTGGTRLKRRRRPSDKVMELQVEKVKKSSQRMKPSGK